ncbi:hypothetical protein A3C96_02710 [Candidatus Uhrbacteria bacterium RIFCSPHIGHO2_02_FULL_60_10]|uniref:Uncharacterized protein n=1 Tax=Candidatus Uhrbacteria bacterium RIFCSPHIGHO2_02_FULL_60_10 TaxID=1802392 RepID=A0A1F7U6U1_9BACT|nr:MAG: hypothetical protein A3C96_02710 [Candidatus Uhrbacteria bacterium RIFCSPHIGHO2_02_FULL_60_10]
MGKKGFIKGLAVGAVLGAVAAVISKMDSRERDKKAVAVKKTAAHIANRVATHAKTLGRLTKSAYHQIVDATVAEYRGTKALSEDELSSLKKELKEDWGKLEKILKKK